ncbi:hypothetical protein WMY93_008705 [Mugilogobius chulae]|uniref:Cat eye syndrome critical region protein 5 n=1 Tax=Mugilogobius chulae TaxID=88201 RepID=A0AAW0PCX2_9GOBI
MWSRAGLQVFRRHSRGAAQAGLLLDVDGVLIRGRSVVPAARRAFQKLQTPNKDFLFPVVFVTNAGSCHREQRANQLSELLHTQVRPEQVVLSYSPLSMMKNLHHKVVSLWPGTNHSHRSQAGF